MEGPITQATGHNNTIVAVYADRIDIKSGWQSQNLESVSGNCCCVIITAL